MMDDLDLAERPSAAELTAAKAEIIAFREQHKTLGTAALAIAFIEQRGSATSSELSVLLDLRPDQYPSVELRSSVQGDRLVCVGRTWKLGPKAIPSTREGDALASSRELGRINKPELQVPTFAPAAAPTGAPTAAPTPAPTAAPAAPRKKSSDCKFAIWSHGLVEIRKSGQGAMELTLDEVDELIEFLTKLGEA
jgi:predicted transcriptional regulator